MAAEGLRATMLTVSAGVSRFAGQSGQPGANPVVTVRLAAPTQDPIVLTRTAVAAMRERLVPETRYVRAGVVFSGLEPAAGQEAFDTFAAEGEERQMGTLLGDVRARFGQAAIGLGHAGLAEPAAWTMKREFASPRYTTEWSDLPVVSA